MKNTITVTLGEQYNGIVEIKDVMESDMYLEPCFTQISDERLYNLNGEFLWETLCQHLQKTLMNCKVVSPINSALVNVKFSEDVNVIKMYLEYLESINACMQMDDLYTLAKSENLKIYFNGTNFEELLRLAN